MLPTGKLILTLPDGQTQEYPLINASVTLGRADTNDIILQYTGVSRSHARIESGDAGITLIDLNSTRGSHVNGRKVKRVLLADGDTIQLGECTLRFETTLSQVQPDFTVVDNRVFVGIDNPSEHNGAREARERQSARANTSARASTSATANTSGAMPGMGGVLVTIQSEGSRRPLFLVASAFVDISAFVSLSQALGPDQPLYALQPPHHGEGRTLNMLKDLVSEYIAAMRMVQHDGPYALAGYGIGGIVALEVAQQLQSLGHTVAFLGLVDTPFMAFNPIPFLNYKVIQGVDRIGEFVSNSLSGLWNSEQLDQMRDQVRDLQEQVERLPEQAREAQERMAAQMPSPVREAQDQFASQMSGGRLGMESGSSAENLWAKVWHNSQEMLEYGRDLIRDEGFETNLRLLQFYMPRRYPGRMTIFMAADSPVRYSGATWMWGQVAVAGVDEHLVPGRFDNMLCAPYVQEFAGHLRLHL